MSFVSQLRKKMGYETNVPRCETCSAFKKPGMFLRESLPIISRPWCKDGDFEVRPNACCDKWRGKNKREVLA